MLLSYTKHPKAFGNFSTDFLYKLHSVYICMKNFFFLISIILFKLQDTQNDTDIYGFDDDPSPSSGDR